jgi:hypothetical protein
MSKRILGVLILGAGIMSSEVAVAQERSPHTGSTAVGIDAGAFVPVDDELDTGLVVNALLEYYVTPRFSLRTNFGLTNPGFARDPDASLRQLPLRLDANYNWERGKWHPFVGAGVGAYFLQIKNNGEAFGDSSTEPGFNLGGGVEYFTSRTVSIKGEARYHRIGDAQGVNPSGMVFTGGLKKYF